MGKGRKAKAVTPAPPSKPLPAQGRGGHKRTPTSAFDPAAGQDIYEPEKVVGERQKNLGGGKTETQYEVKWKGWDKKHNTYEPLSNLVPTSRAVRTWSPSTRKGSGSGTLSWEEPRRATCAGRSGRRRPSTY